MSVRRISIFYFKLKRGKKIRLNLVKTRAADPGGFYLDPTVKITGSDPRKPSQILPLTYNQIHLLLLSFYINVNIINMSILYYNFGQQRPKEFYRDFKS